MLMLMFPILSKNVDFEPSYDVLNFACRIANLFWISLVRFRQFLQQSLSFFAN